MKCNNHRFNDHCNPRYILSGFIDCFGLNFVFFSQAGEGRTTIIIAHRLSTIKNADVIVAVKEGRVAEMGTHDELMELDGLYASLVKLQVCMQSQF